MAESLAPYKIRRYYDGCDVCYIIYDTRKKNASYVMRYEDRSGAQEMCSRLNSKHGLASIESDILGVNI